MKRKVADEIKKLSVGDLIRVEWGDASVGKSLACGTSVDVPVVSWGIYIGVLGDKKKHIIIAQNNFRYADGLYDLDYTAIPLDWSMNVIVIVKNHIEREEARLLLRSFLEGGRRTFSSRKQRIRNHHG